jgi:predicted MFS family arabinose efflux permease
MSPILADVASDFGMSIAEAGQLRILAAPLAAVVALAAGRLLVRFSPRALLVVGSVLLAAGSLASAAAPTFSLLALAQVPTWAGVAILIAAGVAATAAWSEPERRTKLVAHALAGPPAAWIVGMPVIGLVAEIDWRLTFLALPLPAALVALLAVAARPRDVPVAGARASLAGLLGRHDARRWALGELVANSAWTGTLVFSGALFTEVHGASSAATGMALALVAAAYLAGNQWAGRIAPERARRTMLEASVAASAAVTLTWALVPAVAVTLAIFGIAAFVAAARTVAGTVYGFALAGDLGREVGAMRAATTQIGYLVGSLVGGVALAAGGFGALGLAFGGLFLVSTLPYLMRPIYLPCAGRAPTGAVRSRTDPGVACGPAPHRARTHCDRWLRRTGEGTALSAHRGPRVLHSPGRMRPMSL